MSLEGLVVEEVADGVEDRAVQHGEPGMDQLVADGLDQVALPHAWRPGQQHVAMLTDEAARRHVVDLLLFDRAVKVPTEVFQGLLLAEPGRLQAPGNQPFLTHGQLVGQHEFQELDIVQAVGRRLLQSHVQRLGHPAQTQLLQTLTQLSIHRDDAPFGTGVKR